MTNPLAFLRSNNITAVVVYPDDAIPDNIVQQLQTQLSADYYYIDCKGDGPKNAGVFVRNPGAPAYGTNIALPTIPTAPITPPTPVAPAPATPAPTPAK